MNRWIIIGCLLLCACSSPKPATQSQQHYIAKKETLHRTLHFTGTLKPKQESSLTSPMDAVVTNMPVHYGQTVHKGDVIFILHSAELQKQFGDGLTEYLKTKDAYGVAKARFNGTQELWDAGLVSKNNYLSEQSSLASARVQMLQSERRIKELLDKIDGQESADFSSLSLSDFKQVQSVLSKHHDTILIRAQSDGVLLYPPKGAEDKSNRINVGASVKNGQVLGLIGDLSGVSVDIDIAEIDIDKVHTGMKATLSGVAFGEQALYGRLIAINAQAINSGSGLPSFNAVVEVPSLTLKQQQWIKVGMSANIEVELDTEAKLMVPIAALSQEHNTTMVKVKKANGDIESRVVTTGPAKADKVVILSGLNEGDELIYG